MNVLLQPCSGKNPIEHFEDTIANGIPIGYLKEKLEPEAFQDIAELNTDIVKAWGIVPGTRVKDWENLSKGDLVLFYSNKRFFYMCTAFLKVHNPELASSLWGYDGQGRTWEYIFFVREGKSVNLPYDPTILVKQDGEQYASNHIIQGAQLLTDRNANSMLAYLQRIEEADFDEESLEPTQDEEAVFQRTFREPKSPEEAKEEIHRISDEAAKRTVKERVKIAKMVARNPKYARLVKEGAKYICEICGAKPFIQKNGLPYAEAHHKDELAKTKIDNPAEMICVCPTCHRVIHYGSDEALEGRYSLKV